MKTPYTPLLPFGVGALLLLTAPLLAQPAPNSPSAGSPPAIGEALVLSVFEVSANKDHGYAATETLSGSRLNTKIEDTGVAETILTPELMRDLGLTSLDQAYEFVPNTSTSEASLGGNANNSPLFSGVNYTSRGFSVTSSQRDFLPEVVPGDTYNTERISFTRGPNAILYGLGNPGGMANTVSQRANLHRPGFKIDLSADTNDGFRLSANANLPLIKDRLALRLARLQDNRGTYLKPDDNQNFRSYAALRFQPWKRTVIDVNTERGYQDRRALPRNQTYTDGYSSWLNLPAASRPRVTVPGSVTNNTTIPGLNTLGTSQIRALGGATTPIGLQNWASMGSTFIAEPNIGSSIHSVSEDEKYPLPLPLDTNLMGYASSMRVDFYTHAVNVQQEIVRNLNVEATLSRQASVRFSENAARASLDDLYVDPNAVLPDGRPNPNFGKFYYEADGNLFLARLRTDVARATVSYEWDAKEHFTGWGRGLGKHRVALLRQRQEDRNNNMGTITMSNLTPSLTRLPGAAQIWNPAVNVATNNFKYRYYLDPAAGITHLPSIWQQFPLLATADNLAEIRSTVAPDAATGVTLGFANSNQPTVQYLRTDARMLAMQNYWLKDRVITLFGWRHDEIDRDTLTILRNANSLFPDPRTFSAKGNPASTKLTQSGDTFTRGVVLVATPWLRFFYNEASSFSPQDQTATDLYGNSINNADGKGTELGTRISLLGGRLNASLSRWTSDQNGQSTAIIRNQLGLFNFNGAVSQLWNVANALSGDPKYLSPPYRLAQNFTDYLDNSAQGYEFSLTANPTRNWRISWNGGTQKNHQTNLGPVLQQYWQEFSPLWRNFPSRDLNGNGVIDVATPTSPDAQRERFLDRAGGTFGNAIKDVLDSGDLGLGRIIASSGISTSSIPQWSTNLVTNYTFTEGRLKGFAAGANLGLTAPSVIGYLLTPTAVYDRNAPVKSKQTVRNGLWLTYSRKLKFGEARAINWRIQLNARNLLDNQKLRAITAQDDGTGRAVVVRWSLPEPRTFLLSNSFEF